jgi:hypothetical protein
MITEELTSPTSGTESEVIVLRSLSRQWLTLPAGHVGSQPHIIDDIEAGWIELERAFRQPIDLSPRRVDEEPQDRPITPSAVPFGDAEAIEKHFATAKERRDRWCAGGASPSPE